MRVAFRASVCESIRFDSNSTEGLIVDSHEIWTPFVSIAVHEVIPHLQLFGLGWNWSPVLVETDSMRVGVSRPTLSVMPRVFRMLSNQLFAAVCDVNPNSCTKMAELVHAGDGKWDIDESGPIEQCRLKRDFCMC